MDILLYEYENTLIGRAKSVGHYNFFGSDPGGANEQAAVRCIRYAVEDVLCWDVEECVKKLDSYILRLMKLDGLLAYIRWPDGVAEGDIRYILHLLYPARIKFNPTQVVLSTYKQVLAEHVQFPRGYFLGPSGMQRYCICLRYALTYFKPVGSIKEAYEFFHSSAGRQFLGEVRLRVAYDQLCMDLDRCIYIIMRDHEGAKFWYSYYAFRRTWQNVMKGRGRIVN